MFQPPKGTKDFLPEEMIRRNYVINKIKQVFKSYGFDELKTPSFESWELLSKKCGEDIKQQIFRFKDKANREQGLIFDLTVPLARVLASNPNLLKPFKRYQIQPVWRYEEVKKDRRREFWQCDVDIMGVESMEAEAECLSCAVDCLRSLGFKDFTVKINNRKVLEGLLVLADIPKEKDLDAFRAIDKLGKFSENAVKDELKTIGLDEDQISKLFELITLKGDPKKVLDEGEKLLKDEIGKQGLEELKQIFELSKSYGFDKFLNIDFSLARGLDYYTGPIFEINLSEKIGSVCGGGRFDNLIELYGGKPTPATGLSLGVERIIEIMKQEEMFDLPKTNVNIFIAIISNELKDKAIEIAQKLREKDIQVEIDLMNRKFSKQLEYCNKKQIPFVIIIGEKELKKKSVTLKNMETGKEKLVKITDLEKQF